MNPSQNQMQAQIFEMEMYADLFSRMQELCWRKCIAHTNDADLSVGERSCSDRCVAKYLEAHMQVGEILKEQQESAMQQQQAMQQGMSSVGLN